MKWKLNGLRRVDQKKNDVASASCESLRIVVVRFELGTQGEDAVGEHGVVKMRCGQLTYRFIHTSHHPYSKRPAKHFLPSQPHASTTKNMCF